MRIACIFILVACGSWAQGIQNSEIIIMVGGVHSSSSVVLGTPGVISGASGFAIHTNYGYQITSTKAGSLWIETPLTNIFLGVGTITGATFASIDRISYYVTPGLRLKTPTYGRVSFYGLLGGGFGSLSKISSVTSEANGTLTAHSTLTFRPVGDFGGGLDLRLNDRFSLRAEARSFVSAAHLSGVDGHNHPVFLTGIVFHY